MEHPAYTLSALCAIGGVGGFVRRGSVPSLAAGVALGGLYGYSGKLLHDNADGGIEIATATSALLVAGMLPRAIKTRKPVPITLSVVGITALAYYSKKYYDYFIE